MYNLLIVIQYIGIVGLFIESWLVLRSWKDSLRAYLFFSCVVTLINNLGYLLELKARSLDAYITALQLSYAGRIWICFSLFLCVADMNGLKYINDTFGHEHGDKAIAELAGIIRDSYRR